MNSFVAATCWPGLLLAISRTCGPSGWVEIERTPSVKAQPMRVRESVVRGSCYMRFSRSLPVQTTVVTKGTMQFFHYA